MINGFCDTALATVPMYRKLKLNNNYGIYIPFCVNVVQGIGMLMSVKNIVVYCVVQRIRDSIVKPIFYYVSYFYYLIILVLNVIFSQWF